jgi:hypothetical protein
MNQKCIICDQKYIGGFIKPFGLYAHRKCVRSKCVNEYFYKKDHHNVWVMKQFLPHMKCAMKMKHWWSVRHPNQPRSTIQGYAAFWDKKDSRLVNDEWTFEHLWESNRLFRQNTERNLMKQADIESKKLRDREKRKRKFDEKWEIREQKRQRLHNYLIDEYGADADMREDIIKLMLKGLYNKTDYFKFNKKKPKDTVEDVIQKAKENVESWVDFCKWKFDIIEYVQTKRIEDGPDYKVHNPGERFLTNDYFWGEDIVHDYFDRGNPESMTKYEQELFKKYKPLEYFFTNH